MPARTGVAVPNQNQLNAAQLAVLDAVQNTEGWNAGISTTYHEVLRRMGQHAAPSRRLVREHLSTKPSWQMNQIPRAPLADWTCSASIVGRDRHVLRSTEHLQRGTGPGQREK